MANRVAEMRKEKGWSQERLAAEISPPTNKQQIGRLEKGTRKLTQDWMERIAKALGCSPAELIAAKGAVRMSGGGRPKARGAANVLEVAGEEFTVLPVYDVRAAAGAGAINEQETVIYHQIFRTQWLRSVTTSGMRNLAVIQVAGDSMENTFHHGDQVLVDRSVRKPGRDGIYILRSGDELQVKRVQLQPNKLLTIASDNQNYRTFSDQNPDDIEILGRVVWLGRQV